MELELPEPAVVRLEIFDLMGRRVRSLVDGRLEAGLHRTKWDRRDTSGRRVQASIYYARFEAGHHREQAKLFVVP